jgi:TolB-like protein/class 3 adenylate cyclase/Tfp pilus assembly protein PilF
MRRNQWPLGLPLPSRFCNDTLPGTLIGETQLAREQRRLAAILAADVVGYSRLMGRDETGTLARLKTHRSERLEPVLARNGGRLVKLTGDGALAEFGSVVDALTAAIEFQQAVAEANRDKPEDTRIVFRIGLHLGDLIVDGDDLYGDGVNVAARLEAEAPAGGILISRTVHEAVVGRLKATFDDLGSLSLKNIERPLQAFDVKWDALEWPVESSTPGPTALTSLADAPATPPALSIVVLPFANLSNDPEQEFFADGLTEDLTTDLSRLSGSFVIARNTAFTFKGKPVDVKRIGTELGVHYVLEGSVRNIGDRVRLNAQLIDSETGAHLWAERFDYRQSDLLALQDEITGRIANALRVTLIRSAAREAERPHKGKTEAVNLLMRARAIRQKPSAVDSLREARALYEQAIEADPQLIDAWSGVAYILGAIALNFPDEDRTAHLAHADHAVARALSLDRDHAESHFALGRIRMTQGRLTEAAMAFEMALTLDRNHASAYTQLGLVRMWQGSPSETIRLCQQAIRLSPRDPLLGNWQLFVGAAYALQSDDRSALDWLQRAVANNAGYYLSHLWLAAAQWLTGDEGGSRASAAMALQLRPALTVRGWAAREFMREPTYLQLQRRIDCAWQQAGIPE